MSFLTNSKAYRRFLNGDTRTFDATGYRQWRKTVKWTDEQIVAALREYVDTLPEKATYLKQEATLQANFLEKTGRMTGAVLGKAMCILIKTCDVCGKKALYRVGNEGRCSEHRHIKEKYSASKHNRLDQNAAAIERQRKSFDTFDLSSKAARSTGKFKKKGNKS